MSELINGLNLVSPGIRQDYISKKINEGLTNDKNVFKWEEKIKMSELDKVLEWVKRSKYNVSIDDWESGDIVPAYELTNFINELKNPPKKLVWQCRTQSSPEWRNITDEEFELFQHLSRFEFNRVEI